jgi:REP element-mobilizing transposase RayT
MALKMAVATNLQAKIVIMERTLPPHILKLVQSVCSAESPARVLLANTALLSRDVALLEIFVKLGLDWQTGSFLNELDKEAVVSTLLEEYSVPVNTFDVDSYLVSAMPGLEDSAGDLRLKLVSSFYASSLEHLTSPRDLGLELFEESPLCPTQVPPSRHLRMRPNSNVVPIDERPEDENTRSNGLKHLSFQIKTLMERIRPRPYQEVADEILSGVPLVTRNKEREERNVRRRVYDALNVMIASGVIKKNHKYIFWTHQVEDELSRLEHRLKRAKKRVSMKTKQKERLSTQLEAYKHLIKLNQGTPQRTPFMKSPYFVLRTAGPLRYSMASSGDLTYTRNTFSFAQPVTVLQELDVATRLLGKD